MLEQLFSYFTEENLTEFFQSYRAFGPFVAVLSLFIEASSPVFAPARVCCCQCKFVRFMAGVFVDVGRGIFRFYSGFSFYPPFRPAKSTRFYPQASIRKKTDDLGGKTGLRSAVSPALLSIHAFGGGKCCGRTFASQPLAFFIGGALRQVRDDFYGELCRP